MNTNILCSGNATISETSHEITMGKRTVEEIGSNSHVKVSTRRTKTVQHTSRVQDSRVQELKGDLNGSENLLIL